MDLSAYGPLASVFQNQGGYTTPPYVPTQEGMTVGLGGVNALNPASSGGIGLGGGLSLGIQGLSTLGGLIMGLKQLSLANKQFAFNKQFATTNLTNQVKSYNTSLADKLNTRQVMETGSVAGAQAKIDANKLSTTYP